MAWDVSHQEFTIEDHYYFSILKNLLSRRGIAVREVDDFSSIGNFDVLVLNYPEKPFDDNDYLTVKKFLEEGGRVVLLGYYNNEDNIADMVNSLAKRFGLRLNKDAVIDEEHNHNNDKYFVVANWLDSDITKRVLMPCTASVSSEGATSRLVVGGNTAKSTSGYDPIIAASKRVGKGEIIVIGTCVFWDNYSIEKYDNKLFALKLLSWRK